MQCRQAFAVVTAFIFLFGMTVVAEARCGGCKRKGGQFTSAAYQPQGAGSCCSVGSSVQGPSTGSSCCSKGVQNATVSKENQSTCKYCGMNCQQYAKSRMLVEYDGHPPQATCSLHCAAVELAFATNRRLKSIQVGDFVTTEMINAEKAHWVIGGSKPGVMTKTGTWAFNQRKDAETFVQENGGKIGDFAEALDAIYADIKSNIKTISKKQ